MKILTRSSLRFNIYADGYSFLFPEGVNCEEQGNGSETALLRGCSPALWASLFFLFWVTKKTKQNIYIYIYMDGKIDYLPLFLNYLTKQPFFQVSRKILLFWNLILLMSNSAWNSTLAISSSKNMVILLYTLKI